MIPVIVSDQEILLSELRAGNISCMTTIYLCTHTEKELVVCYLEPFVLLKCMCI